MTISFVYDSKKGSTETLTGWMADTLREDHTVSIHSPSDSDSLSTDLIVIGSPIYFEKPLDSVKGFIALNATILREKKVAVFIVGWAKKFSDKVESHIKNNYFGPLISPINEAVISHHMFRGWVLKPDYGQREEAEQWVRSVLDTIS